MSFQASRDLLKRRAANLILALIPAIILALFTPAIALGSDSPDASLKANDLLRQAVENEKLGSNDEYYSWMDRLQKPRGSVTKLMVKTPAGILARTVAINDKPLTAAERQQDDERLNRLLDPQKMRDKANKQREDQQHIERILRALPAAFNCEFSSAPRDDKNHRLECSPNPTFSAPNYESQVLQGMKAVLLIDREDKRMTRIEGTLFRDVTFGWGFIGRLNRGGRIDIAQAKIAGKHWGITRMQLIFDGRVILVKPLHIEETETSWDYRFVPKMTVSQALEFLHSSNSSKPAH